MRLHYLFFPSDGAVSNTMGRQRQRQRERRRQQQETSRPAKATTPAGAGIGRGTWIAAGIVLIAAIAVFAFALLSGLGQSKTGAAGPTATSMPATTTAAHTAPTIDGVACGSTEQLAYHIHEHIDLYDHGRHVNIPAYIGIPTYIQNNQVNLRCFYWIHVHAETPNIIHVESPIKKTLVLGDFFDIWAATASTTLPTGDAFVQKLTASPGEVTTYYNGKPWKGGFRTIPLTSHGVITIEIGKPVVAPKPFTNWGNL